MTPLQSDKDEHIRMYIRDPLHSGNECTHSPYMHVFLHTCMYNTTHGEETTHAKPKAFLIIIRRD